MTISLFPHIKSRLVVSPPLGSLSITYASLNLPLIDHAIFVASLVHAVDEEGGRGCWPADSFLTCSLCADPLILWVGDPQYLAFLCRDTLAFRFAQR